MFKQKEEPEQLPESGQLTRFYYHDYPVYPFEKDCRSLEAKGWKLVHFANVGRAPAGRGSECIVATYEK